jgi:TRAP-type C4-dicarboxylate transport system substrate-binding protein
MKPLTTIALAGALLAAPASAQTIDLTLAVIPAPSDAYAKMTATVPDRIAKATDGRVKITVNDSLIAGPQIAASVRDGRVPMSAALHTYLAADEPRMGLFNLPGLIENMPEYKYVWDAFWGDDLAKIWLEKWNSVVLAEGTWCTQQLFTKEPIHKLEDFRNKKLRVHNPQTAELMNALGAKPVPLQLSEVMPSLERGVIDGLFTSTCYGHGQEYWRIAKNVQNWSLGPLNGWAILVNKDTWATIPPDLQQKIRAEMHKLQHEAFYGYHGFVRAAMDDMKKNGVTFWVAPKSERDRLFDPKYTKPVYESWYKRAKAVGFDGEAYVQRVREVLGKDLGF